MKRSFIKVLGSAQCSIFRVHFSPVKNVAVASGHGHWKRAITISPVLAKNFKYKPIPPKFKLHTPEELFGAPKGWNLSSGGFFLLIIPVSTLLLGIWQVYRWRWKLGVIDEMEKKVHALLLEFPFANLESLNELEYQKVKVRGRFDYSKELVMGPRSLYNYPAEAPYREGGLMSQGSTPTGYHVITPFQIEGQNMRIMVNRGWVSDRFIHKYKGTEEPVEIVCVVRKPEQRQPFMPKDSGRAGFHMFRDVPIMAEKLKTEEVFLDLVSISGLDLSSARLHNLPVPGQTRVTLRNEHVSYFCTWFSLSGITSYMWYRQFILRKPLR